MAGPKYSRIGERSSGPSATLIIIVSLLVGCLLIGAWVITSPAAIPDGENESPAVKSSPVETVDTTPTEETKTTPRTEEPTEEAQEDPPALEEEAPAVEEQTPVVQEESPVEEEAPAEDESAPETTTTETPVEKTTATLPDAELTSETQQSNSTSFETQAQESKDEKEATKEEGQLTSQQSPSSGSQDVPEWKLCSFEGAQDYIPCLDNKAAIKNLVSTKHYEHRERHCPTEEELPKCLLPLPAGYKVPIKWPESRDQVCSISYLGLISGCTS